MPTPFSLLSSLTYAYSEELKEPGTLGVLGITSQDIFSNDNNFVFGLAAPGRGVVSCNRFITSNADNGMTIKKTVMQTLSSAGFILGIPRCSLPTCARSYVSNVEDQDEKEAKLCIECQSSLIDLYSKE